MSSGTLSLEEKKIRKKESDKLFKETHSNYYKNYRKKYNQDNKKRMEEYTKKWRVENPEKVKEQHKRSWQKNHDVLIQKTQEWRNNNPDKIKAYSAQYCQDHKEELKQKAMEKRRENGGLPMAENKDCSAFLGVYVAERVLAHVFESVTRMPYGNPGYDFICPKGFKIDVKSTCIRQMRNGYDLQGFKFHIRKNQIPDYFLCLAFNNRDDLEPIKIWLIPAKNINHLEGLSISIDPKSLEKWSQYELNDKLEKVINCCDVLKGVVSNDL